MRIQTTRVPWFPLGLALALALGSGAANADMYKCPGPDGETLYTSDASQCPGASAHVPDGSVQRGHSGRSTPSNAALPVLRRSPPPARPATDAEAGAWRVKRGQAERELSDVEARLAYVSRGLTLCNRGRNLYSEDKDTGLREAYSCTDVKREHGQLEAEQQRLKAYLSGGLEEECRRAGCLPGWVR